MRLSSKIAIVTGAGSGIGKATVELFRAEGATVIGADLRGADVACDAGDEAQVAALIADTVAQHGGLDIFFANAGVAGGLASIFEQSADDWSEILRVNLIGPAVAIKHAAPHIKARGGGSIVCTASVAGLRSGAGGPAYSASKAGVISLVKTDFAKALWENPDTLKAVTRGTPLRRIGEPHEIAGAAVYLASPASTFMTGQVMVVDGGSTIGIGL